LQVASCKLQVASYEVQGSKIMRMVASYSCNLQLVT
jgi:hypothetical protein